MNNKCFRCYFLKKWLGERRRFRYTCKSKVNEGGAAVNPNTLKGSRCYQTKRSTFVHTNLLCSSYFPRITRLMIEHASPDCSLTFTAFTALNITRFFVLSMWLLYNLKGLPFATINNNHDNVISRHPKW